MAGTTRSGGWQWPSVNGRAAGPCHRQPGDHHRYLGYPGTFWRPTGTYGVVPARSGGGGGGAKPSALGPRVGWSVPFLLSRRGWWASPSGSGSAAPVGGYLLEVSTQYVLPM